MDSSVRRKQCTGCGRLSLESEGSCWACGGRRFVPAGAPLAGEPTLEFDAVTQSWEAEPRPMPPLAYLGGVVAIALFVGTLGFWIGRASAPSPEVAAAPGLSITPPQVLPPPPDTMGFAPRADPSDQVSVRVRARMMAPLPPAPVIRFGPTEAFSVSQPAASGPSGAARVYVLPAPAAPAGGGALVVRPTETTAVVSLRNDTTGPVRVSLEGDGTRSATIAPGATLPLTLAPGTYLLHATAGPLASPGSNLSVTAGRTYTVSIARKEQDGGPDSLTLTEPAVD